MTRFAFLLFVVCASCVRIEQTVTLNVDGTGIQDLVMELPVWLIDELESKAQALSPRGNATDVRAIFDAAIVRKELGDQGLTLTRHEVKEVRHCRRASMGASFRSLDQLRLSSLAGGRSDWVCEPGPIKGSIRLVYYPRGKEEHESARRKAEEIGKTKLDDRQVDFFQRRLREMKDLDITFRLNLPGTVLFTRGPVRETGLRQVTATIRGADIRSVQDMLLAMAPRIEVVFDGRDCKFASATSRSDKGSPKKPESRPSAVGR